MLTECLETEVKAWEDVRGEGATLVLGSSRSLDCGGLIHNTSCPAPPSQQMALWWQKRFSVGRQRSGSISLRPPLGVDSVLPLPICRKRTCKLDPEEPIRGEGEETFSGLLSLIINPDMRDSGSLYPTSLHLTGIRPPTTPCFSSGASALQQHPLCKFYNHTPAMRDVCVYVQWRGI